MPALIRTQAVAGAYNGSTSTPLTITTAGSGSTLPKAGDVAVAIISLGGATAALPAITSTGWTIRGSTVADYGPSTIVATTTLTADGNVSIATNANGRNSSIEGALVIYAGAQESGVTATFNTTNTYRGTVSSAATSATTTATGVTQAIGAGLLTWHICYYTTTAPTWSTTLPTGRTNWYPTSAYDGTIAGLATYPNVATATASGNKTANLSAARNSLNTTVHVPQSTAAAVSFVSSKSAGNGATNGLWCDKPLGSADNAPSTFRFTGQSTARQRVIIQRFANVHPTSPILSWGFGANTTTAATSQVAPDLSWSPGSFLTDVWTQPTPAAAYTTAPSGMTLDSNYTPPGSGTADLASYTQQYGTSNTLTSGTRTAVYGASTVWTTGGVVLRPADSGGSTAEVLIAWHSQDATQSQTLMDTPAWGGWTLLGTLPRVTGGAGSIKIYYQVLTAPQDQVWKSTTDTVNAATQSYDIGYEQAQLQDGSASNPTTQGTGQPVFQAPGGRPGMATEFVMPSNYTRVEHNPSHRQFIEGDAYYFSFSFWLDADFPLDATSWQVIEQLHGAPGGGSPVVAFEAKNNQLRMTGGANKPKVDTGGWGSTYAYDIPVQSIQRERWYNVVYYVYFSDDPSKSRTDVWVDGVQQVTNYLVPCSTYYSVATVAGGGPTYRKQGFYHDKAIAGGTIWHGGSELARSRAGADPALALSTRTEDLTSTFDSVPAFFTSRSGDYGLFNNGWWIAVDTPTQGTTTTRFTNTAYSYAFTSVSFEVQNLPAYAADGSDSPANFWVYSQSQAAGTRVGFNYDPRDNTLNLLNQVGYADANAVKLTAAYFTGQHRWWRIRNTGAYVIWETSRSGAPGTWVERRRVAAPTWTNNKDHQLSWVTSTSYDNGATTEWFTFDNLSVNGVAGSTSAASIVLGQSASGVKSEAKTGVGSLNLAIANPSTGFKQSSGARTQNLALGQSATGAKRRSSSQAVSLLLGQSSAGSKTRSGTGQAFTNGSATSLGSARRVGSSTVALSTGSLSFGARRSIGSSTQNLALSGTSTGRQSYSPTGTGTTGTSLGIGRTGQKRSPQVGYTWLGNQSLALAQFGVGSRRNSSTRTQAVSLGQSSTGSSRRIGVGTAGLALAALSNASTRPGRGTATTTFGTNSSGRNAGTGQGSTSLLLGLARTGTKRTTTASTTSLTSGATGQGTKRKVAATTDRATTATSATGTGAKARSGTGTASMSLDVTRTGAKRVSGGVSQGLALSQSSTGRKQVSRGGSVALSTAQGSAGPKRGLGLGTAAANYLGTGTGSKRSPMVGYSWFARVPAIVLTGTSTGSYYAQGSGSAGIKLGSSSTRFRAGVGTAVMNLALVGSQPTKRIIGQTQTIPMNFGLTTPPFNKTMSRVGSGRIGLRMSQDDTTGMVPLPRNTNPIAYGPYIGTANGTRASVSISPLAGDLVIVMGYNISGSYAQFGNISGMSNSWVELQGADAGSTNPHIKPYYAYASATGTYTVSVSHTFNNAIGLVVYIVRGAPTTNPIERVLNNTGDSAYPSTPGYNAVTDQGLELDLACTYYEGDFSTTGTNTTYQGQRDTTSTRATIAYGYSNLGRPGAVPSSGFYISDGADDWAMTSIVIRNGGTRLRGRGQAWLDIDAQPEDKYRFGPVAQSTTLGIAASNIRLGKSGAVGSGNNILLGFSLPGRKQIDTRAIPTVIDVKLGNSVRGPTRAPIYTGRPQPPRPMRRKTTRFLAQDIRTRKWLHPDLPFSQPKITWTLSGPSLIEGVFAPEMSELLDDQGNPLLMAYATYIHVEVDGQIRCSGIMQPPTWNGDQWTVRCEGISSYPHGMFYTGEWNAIRVDPITVFYELWRHVSSFADAKTGVEVIKHIHGAWPESAYLGNQVTVKDATSTTATEKAKGNPNLGKAATELKNRVTSGGSYYEDFSFTGMSSNMAAYNDTLADGWYAKHKENDSWKNRTALAAYLDTVITANPVSTTQSNADGSTTTEVKEEILIIRVLQGTVSDAVWKALLSKGYKIKTEDGGAQVIYVPQDVYEIILKVPANTDYTPYTLSWWDLPDIGRVQDELAGQTPFDYWENVAWNDAKDDVKVELHCSYPRIGEKRNLRFVSGENIIETAPLEEASDFFGYASTVAGIGAGEGRAAIRSFASLQDPRRLRRMTAYKNSKIKKKEDLDKLTQQYLSNRGDNRRIPTIVLDAKHENAQVGTFFVGDDIYVQARMPWVGWVRLWHRITAMEYDPTLERLTLTLERSDAFMYGEATPENT